MIEKLVATLEQKVKDLTAEEIADILWLTFQQWQSELSKDINVQHEQLFLNVPEVETLSAENPIQIPPPSGEVVLPSGFQQPESAGITTRPPQKNVETETSSNLAAPLAIPDSPSLRNSLDILRALRPLIRLVPSARESYLDVPATVKAIAETDLWLLKLRPVLEPWLELALVVDATPSMVIWQRTILHLRRVLAQSGVFRDVRLWSLETEDLVTNVPEASNQKISQRLCIRSGFGIATATQPSCRPQELIDPNGRRLILVVSDCIDPRWDEQPIRNLLQVWASHSPMGLVQVLPEWLWSRTALGQVAKGQMVGLSAGQPSQSLTFVRRDRWRRSAPVGVKVPVLTLESAVANRWSQMVAGKSSVSAAGLVFAPVVVREISPAINLQDSEEVLPELTPQERLDQFRDFSSSLARQLAGLLAACPEVNLPIVRMVQAALLPDSQQVHVAEVLLGGLFKPQTEITAYTPADQVQYVFHDGVQSLVQGTISPKQAFNSLSAWVKRRFGYALEDFRAYLTEVQSEEIQPFAGVMLDVLNRQSSQYADLIEQVKEVSGLDTLSSDLETLNDGLNEINLTQQVESSFIDLLESENSYIDFPALEVLGFTTAQLVESSDEAVSEADSSWLPPLQTEEYTVAIIAFDSTVSTPTAVELELFQFKVGSLVKNFWRRWSAKKTNGQAYRYIERINETVVIEMVAISGGEFMMGSPAEELDRYDFESPQHLVTVRDFYMGRYPVTQTQWQVVANSMPQVNRFLKSDPSNFKGENRPVEQVSWEEAIEFCNRLTAYTKRQYRLPSEAEWEYACRAGTITPFYFGETISPELANYDSSVAYADGATGKHRGETTPVDCFKIANAWGLCDMHGNVLEWCQDHWHNNYEGAPDDGSAWLITDSPDASRLLRGGSWNYYPRCCRSTYRYDYKPDVRLNPLGFRVSCSAPETLPLSLEE